MRTSSKWISGWWKRRIRRSKFGKIAGSGVLRRLQHFQKAVVCPENRLGFGHFTKLSVKAFHGIGGINQSANFLLEFEIDTLDWASYSARMLKF